MVRLDNGEIAVVLKTHAPDPHRPKVKVILDRGGETLRRPYDVNLRDPLEGQPTKIAAPVEPSLYAFDPLTYL